MFKVTPASIPDVLVIQPAVFDDERGYFFESFNQREFERATGQRCTFVQDNQSRSYRNVLRGLHYQIHQPQGRLVRILVGEVFDVVVDVRRSSPTFGRWAGTHLSAENRSQLWIPPGFAHGFLALSETVECHYKVTEYRAPEHERCLLWSDPAVGIRWPLETSPILSPRDANGIPLALAETF